MSTLLPPDALTARARQGDTRPVRFVTTTGTFNVEPQYDEEVARLHLDELGVKLTTLRPTLLRHWRRPPLPRSLRAVMASRESALGLSFAARYSATIALSLCACGCGDGASSGTTDAELRPDLGECLVTLSLTVGRDVHTLDAEIDYSAVAGEPVTDDPLVRCQRLLQRGAAYVALPWMGGERYMTLNFAQDRNETIDAPIDLTRCLFAIDGTAPSPSEFAVRLTDASGVDSRPITDPEPVIAVTDVACFDPDDSGTSTSTTSTSMPADCAALDCAAAEACIDGSCVATDEFEIEIRMTSHESLDSLLFEVHYALGDGRFVGDDLDVRCERNQAINGFVLFNHLVGPHDEVETPVVIMGIVSVPGFTGPLWLSRCRFRSAAGAPTADTFDVVVTDAFDADDRFAYPEPTLAVTSTRPLPPQP